MNRHGAIRRVVCPAFATLTLLVVGPVAGPVAGANAAAEVPKRVCDIDWRRGTWHVKQLIRCAAERWDSPGTPGKAITIAECESDLRPEAYNPNGYAGLFQHAMRYWADRAERWGLPDRSAFNARANAIVSIRMAAAIGSWSPWAGCG